MSNEWYCWVTPNLATSKVLLCVEIYKSLKIIKLKHECVYMALENAGELFIKREWLNQRHD